MGAYFAGLIWLALMVRGRISSRNNTRRQNNGLSARDAWEGSFWDTKNPVALRVALRIKYRNQNNETTHRVVSVRQFDRANRTGLIIGHCHLRDATRTFRMDRILECVDMETGEVVDDVYAYLTEKYQTSPEYNRDQLSTEQYDVLRIIFYVGKADGQLRAAERVIIRDTCRAIAGDDRITDDMIDEMFSGMGTPSPQSFKLAVGRLQNRPHNEKMRIIDASESIIATQKEAHPVEAEAIGYLRRKWGIPGAV
jgi:hypothetical protein